MGEPFMRRDPEGKIRNPKRVKRRIRKVSAPYRRPVGTFIKKLIFYGVLFFVMISSLTWMIVMGWNWIGGILLFPPMILWLVVFFGGSAVNHCAEDTYKILVGDKGLYTSRDFVMGGHVMSVHLSAKQKDIIKWGKSYAKDIKNVPTDKVLYMEVFGCNGIISLPIKDEGLYVVAQARKLSQKGYERIRKLQDEELKKTGKIQTKLASRYISGELFNKYYVIRQRFTLYIVGSLECGMFNDIFDYLKDTMGANDWDYVFIAHDWLPEDAPVGMPQPTNLLSDMWDVRRRNFELNAENDLLRIDRSRADSMRWGDPYGKPRPFDPDKLRKR